MKHRFAGMLAATLFTLTTSSGQGTISTFYTFSGAGSAGFAINPQGTVYLTDSANDRVRKLSGGVLSILAGNGTFGIYTGDNGPAVNAGINITSSGISGVALDSSGNVYFSDSANMVVRKINIATGVITTYAGNGAGAGTSFGTFTGDGGPAASAGLDTPGDLAIDGNGNLFILDTGNNRVRKVTPAGVISTFAGNGHAAYEGDNVQASATAVPSPDGIAVDALGNVYITSLRRVRMVTAATGVITTIAGTGVNGYSGDGGLATSAQLKSPLGIAVDQGGNVFFTDRNTGGRVRRVDAATHIITSIAGIDGNSSTPLGDGGPATTGFFLNPTDLMIDASGNLYVATNGSSNGLIRKITASGTGLLSAPTSLSFAFSIGGTNPASQTLNVTSSGGALGYTASASSTGNWLSVTPGNGTTPGTLTVSVSPTGLGGGQTYQGSITVTPTGSGNSGTSIPVSLTVTGAGAPTINTTGGVVNATGYQAKLAPGTVFSIFGTNMGPGTIAIASPPNYPSSLSGTSVTLTPVAGGAAIQARLYYSLTNAVSAILPSSIPVGTYNLTVTYNGLTSAAQQVTVVARSFGIAAASGYGAGTAQATDANINGSLSLTRFTAGSAAGPGFTWTLTPAHPGDTIVLWGTGGGSAPANDTGGSFQDTSGTFVVTIGARQVVPDYVGAVLSYPGLWQVNVKIPSDFTPDCFTNVSVTSGPETGNTVTVPIAAAGATTCADPTSPASILSKIDAGANITDGPYALSRITDTLANSTSEAASGGIYNFNPVEWTILNSGPVFGACRLYDRTYPQGGKDPATADSTLNAGSKLTLSGQNLAQGFGLNNVQQTLGPFYSASGLTTGTFANSSYTLAGPGGTDVGSFTSTTTFPSSFNATNFNSITAINRNQPLTFTWTGTGIDTVAILITSSLTVAGVVHITTLNCNVPAGPGSYTVPQAALATLLPANVSGTNFGAVSISGQNTQGKYSANLIKGGQLDLGTFTSMIGVSKNIAVQ